ncbi:hypothetical protein [Glycomyces tarimensis]
MSSRIIEVRYRTAACVVSIVSGAALVPVSIVSIVTEQWDLQGMWGIGILLVVWGVRMTSTPCRTYDVRAKTLWIHWVGTRRARATFGAPSEELLFAEDGKLRRIGADGRAKLAVVRWACDRADFDRLLRVIDSQDRSRLAKERAKHRTSDIQQA